MKLSKISVYLLILAALAAWLYFVEIKQKDKKQADEDKASKIVNIEKDQIVQIDLKSGDGVNIELKKPDEWVITAPLNTRADQAAVGSLLQSATDARSRENCSRKRCQMGRIRSGKACFFCCPHDEGWED